MPKKVTRTPGAASKRRSNAKRHAPIELSFCEQLTGTLKPRILLAGDSWAYFMGGSPFPSALAELGYNRRAVRHIATRGTLPYLVAVPGSRAKDWTKHSLWMHNLRHVLHHQPALRVVHLSLGGNDFIQGWRSKRQEKSLAANTLRHVAGVIETIQELRPDLHVAYHSYDWPNLEVPHESRWYDDIGHLAQRSYVQLFHWLAGSPRVHVLNSAIHRFCEAQHEFIAREFPSVEFWEHLGFGHWLVNNREEIDIAAFGHIPTPTEVLQADGFHFNGWANKELALELLKESYLAHLGLAKPTHRATAKVRIRKVKVVA
jgi:hypothetical protein